MKKYECSYIDLQVKWKSRFYKSLCGMETDQGFNNDLKCIVVQGIMINIKIWWIYWVVYVVDIRKWSGEVL